LVKTISDYSNFLGAPEKFKWCAEFWWRVRAIPWERLPRIYFKSRYRFSCSSSRVYWSDNWK